MDDAPITGHRTERLERTMQTEIVPRLAVPHRAGPLTPSTPPGVGRLVNEADVSGFIAAVRGLDDQRSVTMVSSLIADGVSLESIYVDLMAPAARRFGQMWESDECDFVDVTVALGRMQRLLRDLSQVFLADAARTETVGNILLTCVAGEQHTLGIIMVGEFLIRDGWRVLVGAPWTDHDLLQMVSSEWYDVIGFSVGCDSRLSVLKREIRRLRSASRNPNIKVMVGGRIFADEPESVTRVGADAAALDAREAPRIARALLLSSLDVARLVRREAISGNGEFREAVRRD